jgi:hypothetical protein
VKNVARLVLTLLAGGAFVAVSRADDPSSQVLSATDKLSLQDGDGTPLIISHPEAKEASPSEIAAARQRAQQAASNQDWLLNSYEQLEQKKANASGDQSNNLYYRIASDKNLAKLAGVSPIDVPIDTSTALKTGSTGAGHNSLGLRPDTLPSNTTPSPTSPIMPLITPLGAANAAGLHNFYSSLPAIVPTQKKTDIDPSDLDMPGKMAADSDPMAKDKLSFDSLPDDTASIKTLHDPSASRALPLTTNMAQIQKLTDATLTAPGTVKTVTSPNVSTLQLKLAADPPPPKLVAPVSSGHASIANPYSILDH